MARAPLPEKTFPRGGKKQKKWTSGDADFSLFKSKKTSKIKKNQQPKKKSKNVEAENDAKCLTAATVQDLAPTDVKIGSVILGLVERVLEASVELSLPGSLRAIISASDVSSVYTERIKKQDRQLPSLTEIFNLNDEYPVIVVEKYEETPKKVKGSLNPKDVNSKLSARFLQCGMQLTGAVLNEEEHGYVIDLGIPKVTAFLNKNVAADGYSYIPGRLVNVVVKKLSSDRHSVQVAALDKRKELPELTSELPIGCFVPGFRWKLMVVKTIKNGLEVALKGFGPDLKGYIHLNYLNKLFDKLDDYPEGTEISGTLLYVLPLLNYPFFKITDHEKPKWSIPYGALIENVRVVKSNNKGLVGKINTKTGKEKCFIPVTRVNQHEQIVAGEKKLIQLYPIGTVLPLVRIEYPARLSRYYFGAIDKASLRNQIYSKRDLHVGQVVTCKMVVVGKSYCTVEISKQVKGFVPLLHMSDRPGIDVASKFKPGQVLKGRILTMGDDEERVRVTLKPTLVKTERVLSDETKVVVGQHYMGAVLRVDRVKEKLIIEFFGGRIGEIYKRNLQIHHKADIASNYSAGQLVKCYVVSDENQQLTLSLNYDVKVLSLLKIGYEYKATVSAVADEGVYLDIDAAPNSTCPGFLPRELISSNRGVSAQIMELYSIEDEVSVTCVHLDHLRSPPALLTTHSQIINYYKINREKELKFEIDATIPCFYLPGERNKRALTPAIAHKDEFLKVLDLHKRSGRVDFQVVFALICDIEANKILCYTSVSKVWDHNFMSSLDYLSSIVEELETNRKNMKKSALKGLFIEQSVEAVAEPSLPNFPTKLKLTSTENVEAKCWKHIDVGTKVKGRIIWIDFDELIVWVDPYPNNEKFQVTTEKKSSVRARVVHVCADVIIADALGSHELVFIPTRRHLNESRPLEAVYKVGDVAKFNIYKIKSKLYGIDREIVKASKRALEMKSVMSVMSAAPPSKKRKVDDVVVEKKGNDVVEYDEETKDDEDFVKSCGKDTDLTVEFVKEGRGLKPDKVKIEMLSDEEIIPPSTNSTHSVDESDAEVKSECESNDDATDDIVMESDSSDSDEEMEESKATNVGLDVGFDWSVADKPQLVSGPNRSAQLQESSSESEEEKDEDDSAKKKKKRLTGAEKRTKALEMEEKLRAREQELVDPTRPPQSADDFDRLVASTPEDSSVWLQYMAFHLQNTEIEKARAVARRALKVISFREEQEKLNVWFALLNLEQLYGTAETQKHVLEEALRCNEPYKVHLHKLNTLADAGLGLEAEQLANVMLRKYGENEVVWCETGAALMKIGKLDFARNILQRAMSSLPNSKHVALITRFAQLENKFGSAERAQTLYENVLAAFPKRVDVWSAYVDLMVKSERLDLARRILERATSQVLPPKKMKVLFKKFIAFEETHGTPENVDKIRQAAAEYLQTVNDDEKNQ